MAKDNTVFILQKHLLNTSKNAKYTCKSVQNEIIHIYGSKMELSWVLKDCPSRAGPLTLRDDRFPAADVCCGLYNCVQYGRPFPPQFQQVITRCLFLL